MSAPIHDLYREVILEESRSPQNTGTIENPDAHSRQMNTTCGDLIDLYLAYGANAEPIIDDIKFKAQGCALTVSSSSFMTQLVKGQTLTDARQLAEAFRGFMMNKNPLPEALETLEIYEGAKQFPMRIKCVLLPWAALINALDSAAATAPHVQQ